MSHPAPGGQPPPPEPEERGIEVGLWPFVGSLVGVLVVCVVIGLVLFLTREGDAAAVGTHTHATHPRGAVNGPPHLSVDVDGDRLTFTLSHAEHRSGDTYVLRTGPSPEAASKDEQPLYVRGGDEDLEVRVGPGQRQCAMAQLVRGDQRSGWSQVRCEEAKDE